MNSKSRIKNQEIVLFMDAISWLCLRIILTRSGVKLDSNSKNEQKNKRQSISRACKIKSRRFRRIGEPLLATPF